MLFYLFTRHHITPSQFYSLPAGERVLINAFAQHEIEIRMEGRT